MPHEPGVVGGGGKWTELLKEESSRTVAGARNVVVLGGNGDESTEALWLDLLQLDAQQQNKIARTAPLLYGVMHFDTADSDETQRVGLWLLKGGPTMADGLLHVCLCPKKLRNAGIILHINLAKPAEWVTKLGKHVTDAELAGEVSAEELQALKHRVELLVRRKGGLPHARKEVTGLEGGGHVGGGGYGEEERSVDTNVNGGGQDDRGEVGGGGKVSSDETLPLPEGVLATSETLTTLFPALKSCSVGLPVPVTVVATNSEALDRLTPAVEKALFHGIRTFCMALGAGLVVLGDKGVGAGAGGRGGGERETDGEESLIGCMRGYLQYLLFGGRLAPPAQVIERTRTFIPAGWDTGPRINLLSPPPSGSLAELVSGAGGGGIGGGGGGDTGKDDVRPRPLIVADDQMLKLEIQEALSKDPAALKDAAALGLPSRTPRPAVATSTKNSTSAHTPRTPASSSARGTGDDCAVAGEAERGGGGVGGTPGGKELRSKVSHGDVNDQDLTDYFASLLQKPTPSSDRKKLAAKKESD